MNNTLFKQVEQKPPFYARQLEAIHKITTEILSAQSTREIATTALDHLQYLIPYRRGTIILFDFTMAQGVIFALHTKDTTHLILDQRYTLAELGYLPYLQPDEYLLIKDITVQTERSIGVLAEDHYSVLSVPLFYNTELIGALTLSASSTNAFSSDQIEFAHEVADLLAMVINDAQLRENEQEARHLAETIQATNLALTQSLDLDTVQETLLDHLKLLVPYDTANVMLLDEDSQITIHAIRGYEQWTDPDQFRQITFDARNTATMQTLLKTQKSLLIPDTHNYLGWQHRAGTEYIRNWMGIPLVLGNQVIGLYSLDKAQAEFFTQKHLELAEMLAPQAALAIQNAQFYQDAQKRLKDLSLLVNASATVSTVLDVNTVVKIIVQEVASAMNADGCALSLWQQSQDAVVTLLDYVSKSSDWEEAPGTFYPLADYPTTQRVLTENQPIIIQVSDPHVDPAEADLLKNWKTSTLLMLPLTVHNQVIGLLEVMTIDERTFSATDIDLCQTLANHLALALENARLFERIQKQATELEQHVAERTVELTRANKQLHQEIGEREKTDQALRESRQKYQMLVERMNDGLAIYSPEGTLTYTNDRFNTMLGYVSGELTDHKIYTLFDEANQKIFTEQFTSYASGDDASYEVVMTGKNEQCVPVIVSPSPIFDAEGKFQGSFAVFTDITDRKLTEDALCKNVEQTRLIFELAPIGMGLVALDGTLLQVNQAFCGIVGYTAEELIGRTIMDITHPDDVASSVALDQQLLQGEIPHYQIEKRYIHKQGHIVYVILQVALMRDSDGVPLHFIDQALDITERKRAETQLLHNAFHDTLTGLPNRDLFLHQLEHALGRVTLNHNYKFAVLFLDLDRFKVINDSLGHIVGDQLLVSIARRLETHIRPGDIVARLGGDEFAIFLDDIKIENQIEYLVHQIQHQVSQPLVLNDQEVSTTASIGITLSTRGYTNPEDFLRDADTAMYRAKAKGGAKHAMFDTNMHMRLLMRLKLEAELRQAFERQELEVYYQPVVSMATNQITKFEALLRWPHNQRGFISPVEFIPIAEETGLIIPIGQWLLHTTCTQAKTWHQLGHTDLRIAVNVSVRQFQHQNLLALVQAVLQETGLNPKALELEITESIAMHSEDFSVDPLHQLNQMGVQLSIDDFGTGYSSLSRLKSLPVSTLKIDQSFIKGISADAESKTIITAMIAMAHTLQLNVVAEGVETVEQLEFLRSQQCDEIQGFIFSPPLSAQKLTLLLQAKSPILSKPHDMASQC